MSTTNLQALTVAISTQGLKNFFKLAGASLFDASFAVPDEKNLGADTYIPTDYGHVYIDGVNVTSGTISQVNLTAEPTVTGLDSDKFAVSLSLGFKVAYHKWKEWGSQTIDTTRGSHTTPFNNTFTDEFSFSISSVTISFDLTSTSQGKWSIGVTNAEQSSLTFGQLNLPKSSVLNDPNAFFKCINKIIREKIIAAIEDVNYASAFAEAINDNLKTIPNSGKLTPSITYEFNPSCSPSANAKGLQVGITGQVLYDNTAYPGKAVSIPLPSIDATSDIATNIGFYEFNALLWAFYKSGDLDGTVTPANTGNPKQLNTKYYKDLIPSLYKFGPDDPINVNIDASQAPTMEAVSAFCITPTVYKSLQSKLNDTSYTALKTMVGSPYLTQSAFNHALQNHLSSTNYDNYVKMLDTAALGTGLTINTAFLVTVEVVIKQIPTFAFSFTVARQDFLGGFQIAANKAVGTLGFTFAEISSKATLVKHDSQIDITQFLVTFFWALFDSALDSRLAKIGNTGVPIPSIAVPGLGRIVLSDESIQIVVADGGYLSFATDVTVSTQ